MVTTTVIVKMGLLRNVRNAYEKSVNMAQSVDCLPILSQEELLE